MAMPALKCPFLSQLTLQQVRASAPHILNAGVESCPIFSQFARKLSTTNVQDSSYSSSSTSRPYTMDEIRAVHEKIYEQKNQQSSASKMKTPMPTFITSLNTKKPNPYGEIIISAECEDLLCPFLKSTPITLLRVRMDQDTIQVNRTLGI